MLVAGLLSALGLGAAGPHSIRQGKSKRGSARRNIASIGSNGMNPTSRADLVIKPPTMTNVPSSVPRSIQSMVTWDTVKFDTQISVGSSGITEQTFYFTLQLHPQYASWAALFDQYCVVQASVTFRSEIAPGSTSLPPIMYTALDFDGNANLSTVTAYEDFSTCELKTMSTGAVVTRSIKPCCKPYVATGNFVVARSWVDTSNTTVPHYGIRSLFVNNGGAETVLATSTVWYAFRNQI